MSVEKHSPDKFPSCPAKSQPNLALFVGSLSEKTDQAALSKYFGKFGDICSVNLISDWTTGASKCCAIIICKKAATLSKILAAPKHILDGKKIRVTEAEPERKGTKKISTNCLFVGNIPSKTKESEIRKVFQCFGNITELKFFRNASTKVNTKNCIVEYSDSLAVEAAFKSKDSKEIAAHGFRISPLKHKNPSKKEKTKKNAPSKLKVKPPSEEEEDRTDQEMEEYGMDINMGEMSPIALATPSNFFAEDFSESDDFQRFTNKNTDIHSELTNSRSHTNSGTAHDDESLEQADPFGCFLTLADLVCEDDLAAAFFSESPYLGSLTQVRAGLAPVQTCFKSYY